MYFMCTCGQECKPVDHGHASIPRVLKRVSDPLELVVMNSQCGCLEQNLGPLQEQ